ncbi:hypothetical protein JCM8097_004435 [Rhodosporidiobolus ruineniae]
MKVLSVLSLTGLAASTVYAAPADESYSSGQYCVQQYGQDGSRYSNQNDGHNCRDYFERQYCENKSGSDGRNPHFSYGVGGRDKYDCDQYFHNKYGGDWHPGNGGGGRGYVKRGYDDRDRYPIRYPDNNKYGGDGKGGKGYIKRDAAYRSDGNKNKHHDDDEHHRPDNNRYPGDRYPGDRYPGDGKYGGKGDAKYGGKGDGKGGKGDGKGGKGYKREVLDVEATKVVDINDKGKDGKHYKRQTGFDNFDGLNSRSDVDVENPSEFDDGAGTTGFLYRRRIAWSKRA